MLKWIVGLVMMSLVGLYAIGMVVLFSSNDYSSKNLIGGLLFPPYSIYVGADALLDDEANDNNIDYYHLYNCGEEYKRWIEYNGLTVYDTKPFEDGVGFRVKKDGKKYEIYFREIANIGDLEIFDTPLQGDDMQKGCEFVGNREIK